MRGRQIERDHEMERDRKRYHEMEREKERDHEMDSNIGFKDGERKKDLKQRELGRKERERERQKETETEVKPVQL